MTIQSRRTPKVCHFALLLLSGTISCTEEDSGPPLVVQRDSAGIEIIEAMRPLWGDSSLWSIDQDPVVDLALSGSGPAHEFHRAGSMKQRPDRSLMIVDGSSLQVRTFSATGEFQASFGRSGDGPGEFRRLQRIENAGDTLLALGDARVTVIAPDLAVIRTFSVDLFTLDLHYLDGGMILPEAYSPVLPGQGERPSGLVWRPVPLVVLDLEGEQIDSIGETRGHEVYVPAGGGFGTGGPIFARASQIAASGQRIYRGTSERMQVEELDMSGNVLRILRIPDYPLGLSDAQIAAERDFYLDAMPPGSPMAALRPVFETAPASETRPAFADMLADPSGAIWLELHRGASEQDHPEEWLVLDADGTWLGKVRIPDRFTVSDITMDAVLGVWRDELDVEHPQVLRLTRN